MRGPKAKGKGRGARYGGGGQQAMICFQDISRRKRGAREDAFYETREHEGAKKEGRPRDPL
jgi:hypothetical protein